MRGKPRASSPRSPEKSRVDRSLRSALVSSHRRSARGCFGLGPGPWFIVTTPPPPARLRERLEVKMAGLSQMQAKLAAYKSDTNEAISLKLVRNLEDLEDDETTFKPEYSHQVFDDNETVFGYQGLQIQLYYSACRLTTLLNIKYTSRVDEAFHGLEADDIDAKLRKYVPPGCCSNVDDFVSLLEKDASFKPFGELLHTYTVPSQETGGDITYQIYKADMTNSGFKEFHSRLQTFLIWFIETASFIDVDDERWNYFLLYEKYMQDGSPRYAVAGYMTVYSYYAYPDKTRPRISQMLVLPPYQGESHGARLLEAVHRFYIAEPNVLDITAEDPSENFSRLRDFVDTKLCMALPAFSPDKLLLGFTRTMATEAQLRLKVNKRQARRVYEILRLKATDGSNQKQFELYCQDVKQRLNLPFKKNNRELEKMRRFLNSEELTAQLQQLDPVRQEQWLEEQLQETLAQYRRVLERIAQA
ncbi:histone acetyltransferase type B catalytic subunit isoform X2 [Petromyzon marinus]|uniref:histone acetyltransferase type B catalytic subunit isoform X2 n=1 Tax=Petromyzon marinus TaxID=7757 RepID=UPI003F6FBCCE